MFEIQESNLTPFVLLILKKLKEAKDRKPMVDYYADLFISEGLFSRDEYEACGERFNLFQKRVSELTKEYSLPKAMVEALKEYPEFKFNFVKNES